MALALAAAGQVHAVPAVPASPNEQRVALVIGNATYKESPLKNAANDAADVGAVLTDLGFKVTLKTNLNQRQMKQALREFAQDLKRGGVGMFYFAGHGIQSKGRNYLLPVGTNLENEAELEDEAVDANLVLSYMDEAQNRVNIVVLDACRNNPFQKSFRSTNRGLAQMDAATGTFLAYSTAPGSIASDGDGRNGVFTKHLIASLKDPDSKLEDVFKRVRVQVAKETSNKQIPWESSSLTGDFFFRKPASLQDTGSILDTGSSAAPAVPDGATFELAFWDAIKTSNNAEDYAAYLEQYPKGRFVPLAKARMRSLSVQSQPPGSLMAEPRPSQQKDSERKAQEQKLADQQEADRRAAEQKLAAQREVEQKAADKLAGDKKLAEQRSADKRDAELADAKRRAADQALADKRDSDRRAAEQKLAEQSAMQQKPAEPRVSAQQPILLASAAPSAAVASKRSSDIMVSVGDTWTYRMLDGVFNRKVATINTTVQEASSTRIVGKLSIPERGVEQVMELGPDAKMVELTAQGFLYSEFAPYITSFGALSPNGNWQNVPGLASSNSSPWVVTARVAGTEKVVVPAGTFDSVRVDVHAERQGGNNADVVRIEYSFWFAQPVKRFVKQTRKTYCFGGSYFKGDEDIIELVNYTLK